MLLCGWTLVFVFVCFLYVFFFFSVRHGAMAITLHIAVNNDVMHVQVNQFASTESIMMGIAAATGLDYNDISLYNEEGALVIPSYAMKDNTKLRMCVVPADDGDGDDDDCDDDDDGNMDDDNKAKASPKASMKDNSCKTKL